jgi:hypothetical protein
LGEVALKEDVSGGFRLIVAQLTCGLVGSSMDFQVVKGPEPILHCMPDEEASFGRHPSLPNNTVEGTLSSAHKLSFVCRARGVDAVRIEGPGDHVIGPSGEDGVLPKSPQGEKLGKVLHGEVRNEDVGNPFVVVNSIKKQHASFS